MKRPLRLHRPLSRNVGEGLAPPVQGAPTDLYVPRRIRVIRPSRRRGGVLPRPWGAIEFAGGYHKNAGAFCTGGVEPLPYVYLGGFCGFATAHSGS